MTKDVPRILRQLKINDVSSVDVGAGKGVRVVLTKRDGSQPLLRKHRDGVPTIYSKPLVFGAELDDGALAYLKRDVSDKDRAAMAKDGRALTDGSFPVDDKDDLGKAILAISRAKDFAKAKAHIKRRANALGASDMLPDDWSKSLTKADVALVAERSAVFQVAKAASDFADMMDTMEVGEDVSELQCDVHDAMCAFDCSVQSIMMDDDVAGKAAAITESFTQFKTYLDTLALEDDDEDKTEKRDMSTNNTTASPAVQKMIEDAVAKALAATNSEKDAVIAKLSAEIAVSKLTKEQRTFHDSLGEEARKAFIAKSSAEMDQEIAKARARADEDPIVKAMQAEVKELRETVAKLTGDKDLDVAKRDAKAMGLTQTDAGDVLMKSRRGDATAHTKLEGYMVELAKSKKAIEQTSKVFDEFGRSGSSEGTGANAYDLIKAKADELRAKNPDLTEAAAFDKAYNDPANKDLRAQDSNERMSKIYRVA